MNKNNNNRGILKEVCLMELNGGFRGDGFDREEFCELEKEASRSGGYIHEAQGINESVKSIKDRIVSSFRLASLSNQKEQSWPSRDPCGCTLEERSGPVQTTSSNSRRSKKSCYFCALILLRLRI